ncbi:50S ribosomal protein L1 [Metallosphaera hakonensis]|uniref:Large ribosomal subunit protein uL1 n=1 Tax=Metallosphaera hakonensis JCM 8857 = DSM 7519 TaxID=1293036 RepID=A0A2U9IVM0_9CREN|nr:50S ribosomal protein L1 [Metallosphaera hakonensis]AWS00056.1 50S ribosomal protein L1 [Metallosphaera hakonensis JCM 8857 = DSM 7519]
MIVPKEKIEEAVKQALDKGNNPKREFTQSVELVIAFKDVDMKRGDIKLREAIVLPKPPSKPRNVLVVPSLEQMESAKRAEPNVILSKEELQKLQGAKRTIKKLASKNQWFLIAQDSMSLAGRILGPSLGPRGKFPTPLPSSSDISEYVLRYKRSTLVKTKDQPHTQTFVGTEDQAAGDLTENIFAVLNGIEGKIKGPAYVKAIYVKTSMGKPVQISLK